MPHQKPDADVTWRELQAVLAEEVQRLPEKYRAPFVLCCLEGKSKPEAAQELGWKEGTVSGRLTQARKQMQQRLVRRGMTLSAVLCTAALSRSAVQAALVNPTIRAALLFAAHKTAAAGIVSGQVAALAEGVTQAMFATKVKIATVFILALGLTVAGAGVATHRQAVLHSAAGAATAATDEPKSPPAAPKESPAPPTDEKNVTFAGRVVDADGKPVAGADVALVGEPKSNAPNDHWLYDKKALARARTDADGKFRLTAARTALAEYYAVYALAGRLGHGLAWAQADRNRPGAETVVRLAPEKTIRGRLLDVQGQPAAGVRVRVSFLHGNGGGVYALPKEGFPAWPGPATTDKDGKFTLAGLNPDLGGWLEIDGEEFTITNAEIKAGKENRSQELNLTLAPARILEGVVTAADIGKPVPRARVVCFEGGRRVSCQTDEKGRYRLRVPAENRGYLPVVSAFPPEGQPYLRRETPLEWPKGAVKHRLDLTLERGVPVRGIVTDAATGKPIAGAKAMFVVYTGGVLWDPNTPRITTGGDGAFALVVPPGRRGYLLVKGPNNDYVAVEISMGELLGGKRSGDGVYPDAVIPIEPKPGADALEVTAKLRRGVTIRGKLLGPGDKRVADALMVCWNRVDGSGLWEGFPRISVPVRDGTFELRGCDPEVTYPVYFLDARNKLGATVRLSAKEAAGKEVTVRLELCGSAVVRFVDKEGKPLKGYQPSPSLVIRSGDKGLQADGTWLVSVDTVNYRGLGPAADAEGRCTFPVLIPGATYSGFFGSKPKELTVKPGEALKFDVVVEPPQ